MGAGQGSGGEAALQSTPGSWASEPNLPWFSSRLPARAGAAAGRDSKMKLWDVVAVCLVLLHTASAFPLPAGKRLLEAPAEDHSLGHRRVPFALTSDCKNRSLPRGHHQRTPEHPTAACTHAVTRGQPRRLCASSLWLSGKGSKAPKGTQLHAAAQGSQAPCKYMGPSIQCR